MPLNWASKLLSCLFALNVTSFICLKNKSSINSLLNSILYHLFLFFIYAPRLGFSPSRTYPVQGLNPEALSSRKVLSSRTARLSNRGIKFLYRLALCTLEIIKHLDCRLSYRFFLFYLPLCLILIFLLFFAGGGEKNISALFSCNTLWNVFL